MTSSKLTLTWNLVDYLKFLSSWKQLNNRSIYQWVLHIARGFQCNETSPIFLEPGLGECAQQGHEHGPTCGTYHHYLPLPHTSSTYIMSCTHLRESSTFIHHKKCDKSLKIYFTLPQRVLNLNTIILTQIHSVLKFWFWFF